MDGKFPKKVKEYSKTLKKWSIKESIGFAWLWLENTNKRIKTERKIIKFKKNFLERNFWLIALIPNNKNPCACEKIAKGINKKLNLWFIE